MNATYTREAAFLGRALPIGVSPGDIAGLIGLLLELLKGCDPTPEGAAKRLQEPAYGFFGVRRAWWRNRVKDAVAQSWKGPPGLVPYVQDAVLERLRSGVSAGTVAALYAGDE